MLKSLKSIFTSQTTARVISAGYDAIASRNSSQPKFAPVAFGGAVVTGIVTILLSGYRVTDCIRYQEAQGQCDAVIEKNLPSMVSGVATLVGGWGAFNTYNPKLHVAPEQQPTNLPTKELVLKEEEIPTPVTPHPEVIVNLHKEGNSQVKIAEVLGISLYAVRKTLREYKETGDK